MEQLPEAWRAVEALPEDPPDLEKPRAARRRLAALGIVALALASAAGALLALTPTGNGLSGPALTGVGIGAAAEPSPGSGTAASEVWMVDVAGAVLHPGLYSLPPGSRVADAIRAAGGYGVRVDATAPAAALNLAEVLHDGAKVVVPERGSSAAAAARRARAPPRTRGPREYPGRVASTSTGRAPPNSTRFPESVPSPRPGSLRRVKSAPSRPSTTCSHARWSRHRS